MAGDGIYLCLQVTTISLSDPCIPRFTQVPTSSLLVRSILPMLVCDVGEPESPGTSVDGTSAPCHNRRALLLVHSVRHTGRTAVSLNLRIQLTSQQVGRADPKPESWNTCSALSHAAHRKYPIQYIRLGPHKMVTVPFPLLSCRYHFL